MKEKNIGIDSQVYFVIGIFKHEGWGHQINQGTIAAININENNDKIYTIIYQAFDDLNRLFRLEKCGCPEETVFTNEHDAIKYAETDIIN